MKYYFLFLIIALIFSCSESTEPDPVLSAPVAKEASDITNNHFTANWNSTEGANDYELDIATDMNFSTIIESLDRLAPSSTVIDELDDNTEYFYRVRATYNGDNASNNSNVISVFTLPDAPVATAATSVSNSGFTANWNEVPGISSYLLSVSEDNFPADPPNNLPDYNGKEVVGTSHAVSGLNSGTIYYYVIRAMNGERLSEYSNSINLTTLN